VLYAVIAFFATAARIPLFRHLQRHPDMLKEATPARPLHWRGHQASDRYRGLRRRRGMRLAHPPLTGVAVFVLIVAYYAATSTGIRTRLLRADCTSEDGSAEEPFLEFRFRSRPGRVSRP
jgi:hypothetical protein